MHAVFYSFINPFFILLQTNYYEAKTLPTKPNFVSYFRIMVSLRFLRKKYHTGRIS